MLPAGVQAYFTRLALRGSSAQELLRMAGQVACAATLLRDAAVDAIVFHCTAASTYSADTSAAIRAQLQLAGGPALSFATSDAIVAAARTLAARRLALLTPYVADVNAREVDFLTRHGFEVLREDGLGLETNEEMARLPPAAIVEQALRCRDDRVDAYFISCTAIRSAEVIEQLEGALGRPVVTSNQAAVWHALRGCGIRDEVAHFGALLRM
jgi:maleate cis-trans isomerase